MTCFDHLLSFFAFDCRKKKKNVTVSRVLHPHVTGMSRVCHGLDSCHGFDFVTGYVTGNVTGLRGLGTGMSRDI